MSEKWYREAHLLVDSERNVLANCGSTKRARQICREHNAVPALVEALRYLMAATADGVHWHPSVLAQAHRKARAALALAEDPS